MGGGGYDGDGNLINDGARVFTYDGDNHLVAESGAATLTLAYDPTGRLQKQATGAFRTTTVTNFVYDGDTLVAEHYGPDGVIAVRAARKARRSGH